MSDADLIAALTKHSDECQRGMWPWVCWCPACAAKVVQMYRDYPYDLPASVFRQVIEAEKRNKQ